MLAGRPVRMRVPRPLRASAWRAGRAVRLVLAVAAAAVAAGLLTVAARRMRSGGRAARSRRALSLAASFLFGLAARQVRALRRPCRAWHDTPDIASLINAVSDASADYHRPAGQEISGFSAGRRHATAPLTLYVNAACIQEKDAVT